MPKPIQSERGKLIDEFSRKHPDAGKRTLAKALVDAGLCETVEQARNCVRYYLGTRGVKARTARGIDEAEAPLGEAGKPVGKLPPGVRQTIEPKRFDGKRLYFAFSDPHIPYHDERCLEAFSRLAFDAKVDGLLCLGDWFDFHQLSRFQRNPAFRSTAQEIETGKLVRQHFDETFPDALKIIKWGNHDVRYLHMIWNSAPQLIGIPEVELANIMQFEANGWHIVEEKQRFSIGNLNGYHGHELSSGMSQPKNLAESLWSKTRQEAFAGHNHRPTWHVDHGGITKRATRSFTMGCTCHMDVDYAIVNGWQQTASLIYVQSDGKWHADHYGYQDGEVVRIA